MAKIPLYQQDKLASQLVGTPGEDQSAQMLAGKVIQNTTALEGETLQAQGQAIKQLNTVVGGVGSEIANQLRRAQYVKDQAEKQQKSLLDQIEANGAIARVRTELNKVSNDIMANRADPNTWQNDFEEKAKALHLGAIDAISNPNVKMLVEKSMPGIIASESNGVGDKALTVRKQRASFDIKNAIEQAATQAGNVDSFKDFAAQLSIIKSQTDPLFVVNDKAEEIIRAGLEKAGKNYLLRQARLNPEAAKQLMDSGIFDTLSEDTKSAVDSKIRSTFSEIREEQNRQEKADRSITQLAVRSITSDADKLDIEAPANKGALLNYKSQLSLMLDDEKSKDNPDPEKIKDIDEGLRHVNSLIGTNEGKLEHAITAQTAAIKEQTRVQKEKLQAEQKAKIQDPQNIIEFANLANQVHTFSNPSPNDKTPSGRLKPAFKTKVANNLPAMMQKADQMFAHGKGSISVAQYENLLQGIAHATDMVKGKLTPEQEQYFLNRAQTDNVRIQAIEKLNSNVVIRARMTNDYYDTKYGLVKKLNRALTTDEDNKISDMALDTVKNTRYE